jgi:thiol-disulfide isomerase/thioredoxin
MNKKLEMAANLAILVVVLLLGYVVIDRYLVHKSPTAVRSIQVGEKVPLTDVDWQRNRRTLVVVLQKGCHFCSESAEFYQKLAREAEHSGKVHLMAVLPQASQEATDYLNEIGVPITDIRQAKPGAVKVRGTPTLLLVGNSGVVERVWVGKLPADKESEVLQAF